jgi:hypothetical protein
MAGDRLDEAKVPERPRNLAEQDHTNKAAVAGMGMAMAMESPRDNLLRRLSNVEDDLFSKLALVRQAKQGLRHAYIRDHDLGVFDAILEALTWK